MKVRAVPHDGDGTFDKSVEDLFVPYAREILTDDQMRTIQFHYQRPDLSAPVYVLLGDGRAFNGTTSSRDEAELHMKRNPTVRSYISSEALLSE